MNTIGGRKFGKDTFYKPLDPLIKQIIDEMLLGDGNIRINHDKSADNVPTLKEYKTALKFLKNLQTLTDITQIPDLQKTITDFNQAIRMLSTFPIAVFRVGKSVLELRYVTDGLIKKFEEAKYTCKAFLSLNKIKKLINDTHVYKIYCQFETRSSVQFTQLYKYWYPHGVKHVPRDLELTPTTVLSWFIDDGSFLGPSIRFATNGFSRLDVEFLAKKIEQTIKVKTRIYKVYDHRYPNHNYWKIYITHKRNIDRFFEYLNESDKSLLNIVKQDLYWKFSSILKKHAVEDLLKTNSWLAFIYKRNFSVEEKKYFLALLKDQLEDLPIDLIHKQCIYKYLFYN